MGITVIIVLLVLAGLGLSIKGSEQIEVKTGFIPHNIEQVEVYGEELMTNVYTTKSQGLNPSFLIYSANKTGLFQVDHGGAVWFNQQTNSEFLYTDSAGKLLRGSEAWVNETGDTMTGNLVMDNANITTTSPFKMGNASHWFCINTTGAFTINMGNAGMVCK